MFSGRGVWEVFNLWLNFYLAELEIEICVSRFLDALEFCEKRGNGNRFFVVLSICYFCGEVNKWVIIRFLYVVFAMDKWRALAQTLVNNCYVMTCFLLSYSQVGS